MEDDEDSAKILARLLRRSGAAVQTADSVAMGLQVALADPHDLLISDIELPDGSGLELMREAATFGLPGVAMSGFGSREDLERSVEAGFTVHLTKPVTVAGLAAAIREVLPCPFAPA